MFCIYYVEGLTPADACEIISTGEKFIKTKENFYILPLGKLDSSGQNLTNETFMTRKDMVGILYGFKGEKVDIANKYKCKFVKKNRKEKTLWYLHELCNKTSFMWLTPGECKAIQDVNDLIVDEDDDSTEKSTN